MNGLAAEYEKEVEFYFLNAQDGAEGQAAFDFYRLRGHPTIVITGPGGDIAETMLGVYTREAVMQKLESVLPGPDR